MPPQLAQATARAISQERVTAMQAGLVLLAILLQETALAMATALVMVHVLTVFANVLLASMELHASFVWNQTTTGTAVAVVIDFDSPVHPFVSYPQCKFCTRVNTCANHGCMCSFSVSFPL